MSPLKEVPDEVLLDIISHFTLKTLIISRGVSSQWRHFVKIADIHPIRRALLNLYLRVVRSPWFIRSRPWVLENLHPFDREAYIHALAQYRCQIPDGFALWILEWPARAAFRGIWPGLPATEVDTSFNPITRARGINSIGALPPKVYTITYRDWTVNEQTGEDLELDSSIPGLAIRRTRRADTTWLLLDESQEFHGMVLLTEIHDFFERDDNPLSVNYALEPSWLSFLEKEREAVNKSFMRLPSDFVTPPPSPPSIFNSGPLPPAPPEWPKITDP